MYRMRLHQGEGTPHSLQTPVGCWRTRNGSTTEDMKDLFFQLMKAVSQISCWVQSDSMIIEGGSLKRCGYGFLINICNETRRRGEGRLLPPSPDPGGQDIGWTDDASVFGHLIPVLFCKYILWCLVVTFHFLLTFVPSALLPFLCSSPARSSPHTCLSTCALSHRCPVTLCSLVCSRQSRPVMPLPCSRACSPALVCPFCLLSVQTRLPEGQMEGAPDWHIYSPVPFTLSVWSTCQYLYSTVVLGRQTERCASILGTHPQSRGRTGAP